MTAASSASEPALAHSSPRGPGARRTAGLAVAVGALGVVFGDIGTSPIYALQTVFNPADPHPVPVDQASIYGVISLMFWSMTIIVTVTYVLLAMRVDNDGEGGIMALITLLRRWKAGRGRKAALTLAALGIFGASLFLGDSMITPAISVLSAVEGLKVVEPSLETAVVPITAVIIVALFAVQRKGTAAVGRLFGPVMIVWFTTIAALGIGGIGHHPDILKALSPTYAAAFLFGHFHIAFFALAAIVLCITGAEALYADMGHFGRKAISKAWLLVVFPACLLSYMGQGALILEDPANVSGPFFLLAPEWARLPLSILATAATVIAAQAVITGAYSVASQASRLGYLPRLRIDHTSAQQYGQIYVPWINWLLMVSVLTLVFAFRSSASLAYAYGMAVMGTIAIMTLLFLYIIKPRWNLPLWAVLGFGGPLLAFELLFVAANFTKLVHGAWLPLLIGVTAFTVMVTWQHGRVIVTAERDRLEGPMRGFVKRMRAELPKSQCVSGTAVFLNRGKLTAPLALRANLEHNHVRHKHIVIVSIETEPVPRIADTDRVQVSYLGYADDGIIHVTARFGYMETQDVPHALSLLEEQEHLHLDQASYFLSTIQLRCGGEPTMAAWRKKLFIATSHITADAAEHFRLPRDRTVIMGSQIEV
ncbi:potassium transporter Kup [Glycomyces harbinensis]|uniref:Probable potassium transport system protein Kup n=1 Tax=Glycomyces harbinensis TaxID=58114 RepID=A0A1G6W1W4_9ACTN|nr:potassium transporter Kup [Glycomyces harbinensis]SDD59035.1 KUP system potassium uptake protein [Glycomyces harbinensis]